MIKINDLFTQTMKGILRGFLESYQLNDNNEKADGIIKFLRKMGGKGSDDKYVWREVGAGTNRIVVYNVNYPDVVFKIALDRRGILDNKMERELYKNYEIIRKYVPNTYETDGIILKAEKINTFRKGDFENNEESCYRILNDLGQVFVLNDVGPTSFRNWGYRDCGDILINDFAYLTPVERITLRHCRVRDCEGELTYDKDLLYMQCRECGARVPISDVTSGYIDECVEMGFVTDTFDEYDNNFDSMTDDEKIISKDISRTLDNAKHENLDNIVNTIVNDVEASTNNHEEVKPEVVEENSHIHVDLTKKQLDRMDVKCKVKVKQNKKEKQKKNKKQQTSGGYEDIQYNDLSDVGISPELMLTRDDVFHNLK